MGAIPIDNPVTCPECSGTGEVRSPIQLSDGTQVAGHARCDVCHGVGRISQSEASAWARGQDPTYDEDPAEVEAHTRYHQWGY